jgi:phospholipid/cholesterol/gamma-HCH transport system permease protein
MNSTARTHGSSATLLREGSLLRLLGRLDHGGVAEVWHPAVDAAKEGGELVLDASGVEYVDGAGAALIAHMTELCAGRGGSLRIQGLHPSFAPLVAMYDEENRKRSAPMMPARLGYVEQIGFQAVAVARDLLRFVAFLGETLAGLAAALVDPRKVRWRDTRGIAEAAGLNALPIIMLIGFVMGLVISFQSAIPLRRFGAELFVADMLGMAMIRELGPLTTAILLAGRSGSAFAAEIGTMEINDEIKALKSMGLSPVKYLGVPRVVAAMMVMPTLTIIFIFFSLVGGSLVIMGFGYSLNTYLNRIQAAVVLGDLLGGLFKAWAFSIVVAAVGCYKGLTTGFGPSAVGGSTTSAVVTCLVLIAILDGIFAIVFFALGI